MSEAGLIEAVLLNDENGVPYRAVIQRLTWQGHEVLDSIRSDNVWHKVVQHVLKPGASWTIETVLAYAKMEALKLLGLPPAP